MGIEMIACIGKRETMIVGKSLKKTPSLFSTYRTRLFPFRIVFHYKMMQ
jgi:hypothetical protein